MNRIRKTLTVSAVALALVPGIANAQGCKSAAKVTGDIFNRFGTEAIALGCTAVKLALDKEGQFSAKDAMSCYSVASFSTKVTGGLTKWWNGKIANNSWANVGPRHLEVNKNLEGKLVGTSGRMFVSFPMAKDKATITITERGGKAKTSVVVCKHEPGENKWTKVATRWFNDSKANKNNKKEKRTITLTGVKGKVISVHTDAKSVANTHSYTLRAQL